MFFDFNFRRAARLLTFGGVVAVAGAFSPELAQAQGRGRFSGDPMELLKRLDANGNGMIDPGEANGRSLSMIQKAAASAGLDPTKPLPIDKLAPAVAQQFQERRGEGSSSDSSSPMPGATPGTPPGTPAPGTPAPGTPTPGTPAPGTTPPGTTPPAGTPGTPPAGTPGTPMPTTTPAPATTTPAGPPKVPGFGEDVKRAPVGGFDGRPISTGIPLEKRFDPRVIEYVDKEILGKFDTNKDTFLDSEEWKANKWSTPPETSDTNKDKRLSREELCVRLSAKFGVPAPSADAAAAAKGPADRSTNNTEQFRKFADSLIKQHDKNKDGFLDREESKELKTEHRSADANSDGIITLDELTAKLASYTPGSAGSSPSPSKSSSSATATTAAPKRAWWKNAPAGASDKSVERRGARALTPTERLPKGLPEWFARSDVDGDGQVMMIEYAASWSESKVAEFQKYDLDGDGLITPEECLAIDGKKK